MKRFFTAIFCALCFVSALAFPAAASADTSITPSPEPGGIGVRLVDIPTNALDDPRARSYIVDQIEPGSTIERRIEVQNNSDTAQSVRIYPGAAHIDSGVFIGEEDPSENELTRWTSVEREQLDLPAGESAMVLVTIDVPADATETEHYGAVWAEVKSESAADSNVIQASRVGIRVYLSVGDGNGKPADFDIGALTASRGADNRPQVSAEITNTGGRAVDISGELALEGGPGGLSAGPFALERTTTIAPGNTGTVNFTLDPALPNGTWDTHLRLESGTVEKDASAQLTFPEAGEEPTVQPEPGIPWGPIAAGAAVVLLVLLAIYVLRARHRKTTES